MGEVAAGQALALGPARRGVVDALQVGLAAFRAAFADAVGDGGDAWIEAHVRSSLGAPVHAQACAERGEGDADRQFQRVVAGERALQQRAFSPPRSSSRRIVAGASPTGVRLMREGHGPAPGQPCASTAT